MTVWLPILAAGLLAVAAHEGSHYAVCRAVGGRPRLAWDWDGPLSGPAVLMHLRAHTPATARLAALAPLALFVPGLLALGVALVHDAPLVVTQVLGMWCLGTVPSLADLRMYRNADTLDDYHAVWFGAHEGHAAAEGIDG